MFEIVNEILQGNFIHESGALDFSCTKIELSISQGQQAEGIFHIYGGQGSMAVGRVISTDYRMELLTEDFSGADSEIGYVFHGESVEAGETVKGAFRVISNQGEYSLPFVCECVHHVPISSMGPIKNLFHFINLAKSDWQEALRLYYSEDFIDILSGSDTQYQSVYRGLSEHPGSEQHMEEFLIWSGKKQAVEYRTESSSFELEIMPGEGEYQLFEQELTIIRNGWGYISLNVDCDGDFLFAEKTVLTEDDFLGNYAHLPVYIDRTYLKQGTNVGRVVFYNSYVNFEVEIRVKLGISHIWNQTEVAGKKCIAQIMVQYEDFRTKKINMATWLKNTGLLVEKLIAMDELDPVARLLKAQLLITQDRENEADWLLSHAKDLMEEQGGVSDDVWAYYLYLTSLLSREAEHVDMVTEEVKKLHKANPDSWRIAWLLLYLSVEYIDSPEKKLRFIEDQFDRGTTSVVLYLEALQIFQGNPACLKKLDGFEQQVLLYGLRKDCCKPELAEQIIEIAEKKKEYSPILCEILELLYEKKADKRIVSIMCTLLLKGGIFGAKALPWYEQGVVQQLRITNLYEAYMSSLDPDEQKTLPKAAVLYFVYNNKLDFERAAFLYDFVLDNKVLYEEVYDKYVVKAREFVEDQIGRERISRHLANLYAKLFTPDMINEKNANAFTRLIFTTRIKVQDLRCRKAIVYHYGSLLGVEYPICDGVVCAPIYGNESTILFEDAYGNRFALNDEMEMEKYMIPGRYLSELEKYDVDIPEFDLYLIRERMGKENWESEFTGKALRLCHYEYIEPNLRKQLALMLLRLFYEREQQEELEDTFSILFQLKLTLEERSEILRYLILSGKNDVAFAWVRTYGPYFMDANTLARLMSAWITGNVSPEPVITAAGIYLFRRGKASAAMYEYLNQWAEGSCKELRDLWKEMKASGMDACSLEERLLVQLMFTGAYVGEKTEIFADYVGNAGITDMTRAFVYQTLYEYFVRERLTDGIVIRTLLEDYLQGNEVPKVCKLAVLKYFADDASELDAQTDRVLDQFLREMMAEKIHFGFYKNLKNQKHLIEELSDKTIVEYRTKPGGCARIHYLISRDDGSTQDYLSENMRDVYSGVCCKEFVLFFGETLQYYVTEEVDGEETLTESGNLQCPELETDAMGSKYELLNDLAISNSLKDYDTLDKGLETYYFREFCSDALFKLK